MKRSDLEVFMAKNFVKPVDLASYWGVTRGAVSQILSGTTKLSTKRLDQLVNNPHGWDTSMFTNGINSPIKVVPIKTKEKGVTSVVGKITLPSVSQMQQTNNEKKIDELSFLLQEYKKINQDLRYIIQQRDEEIARLRQELDAIRGTASDVSSCDADSI